MKDKLTQAYQALASAKVESTVAEGRKLGIALTLLEQCLQELGQEEAKEAPAQDTNKK